MSTAGTETLRSVAVGGEVFFREFIRRNGANRLRKMYKATSGMVASCMAAGIIFLACLHPELKPLARDLASRARHANIAFGAARSDAKSRKSDLLITGCPPLSDAALKSLIDEGIVPAMVDSFLAQKGLIPAGRDGNGRRLVRVGAIACNSGKEL